jgi:hypothetical protein
LTKHGKRRFLQRQKFNILHVGSVQENIDSNVGGSGLVVVVGFGSGKVWIWLSSRWDLDQAKLGFRSGKVGICLSSRWDLVQVKLDFGLVKGGILFR